MFNWLIGEKMKKWISVCVVWALVLVGVVSCADMDSQKNNTVDGTQSSGGVDLAVVTTFAGYDGNAENYRNSYKEWEVLSGNRVMDQSVTSDPSFKARILTDFETGSEPDVLFFFCGADANNFIEAGKVISLEEIRKVYPDYASNMKEDQMTPSMVDGKIYGVPVTGYWEALFVNKEILKEAGVTLPGEDYTWEKFLTDCFHIKRVGYVPIAAALGQIPHYWWEYAIFNHTGASNHLIIPEKVDTPIGQAWVNGLTDIKDLYERNYFPANTISATDDQTFDLFMDGKAAFLLDGSWRANSIVQSCQEDPKDPSTLDEEKLAKYDVVYPPGSKVRKANQIIGGFSMGYYITKKAWDDPEKRAAAVSFISYMTSDEVVWKFSAYANNALIQRSPDSKPTNSLQANAWKMLDNVESITEAVQDRFYGECRIPTIAGMPDIVTGKVDIKEAVERGLEIYYQR
jgi:raffinose/stachyose/melibiose transport system substrate-binding protein